MKDVSRTAWNDFIQCKRCFYLQRKLKIRPIGTPQHVINKRVDTLLKEEFDIYREKQEPHPIFKKHNLNFVPYKMDKEKLDDFRNNRKGVRAKSIKTNFIIYGSIDDLWLNKDNNEVVILDYKATSTKEEINYVTSIKNYHKSNLRQLDFYAYLLKLNKFKVFKTGYWILCNALDKDQKTFGGKLNFTTTLVPYKTNTSWIDKKIAEMKQTLDSENVPEINKSCEKCMYLNAGKDFI